MDITIDEFDKITSIISHFTIIVAMGSLVLQFVQNKRSNRFAYKDRFIACTAKYMKIQEILLSNDKLDHLNISVFESKIPREQGMKSRVFAKELAISGMIFQLMEDVWLTHDLDRHAHDDLYSGWNHLFKDWMNTPEIVEKWTILKFHFSRKFIDYIERRYAESLAKSHARLAETDSLLNEGSRFAYPAQSTEGASSIY